MSRATGTDLSPELPKGLNSGVCLKSYEDSNYDLGHIPELRHAFAPTSICTSISTCIPSISTSISVSIPIFLYEGLLEAPGAQRGAGFRP